MLSFFNYFLKFVFFNYTWHSVLHGVFFFKQDDFLFSQELALGLREGMTMKQFPCERRKCKSRKEKQWRSKPAVSYKLLTTSQLFTVLSPQWKLASAQPDWCFSSPPLLAQQLWPCHCHSSWDMLSELWDTQPVLYSVIIKVLLFLQ